MAVTKPYTEVYGPSTLTASATSALADCTATDCTKATQLVVTFKGTFHASATDGAKITLWPSYDGTNYDTSAWENWEGTTQEWTVSVDAGESVIRTSEPIAPVSKYLKFKVENLDSSYSITSCSLIATSQNAG
jgi:hypothetical protein